MSQQDLIPLALESANYYLTDPHITTGELIGGVLGSAYGPMGSFVGGTVGRMVEKKWSD